MRRINWLLALVMSVCMVSCDSCGGGQGELDGHKKVSANIYKSMIDKENGTAQILDYRSAEEYAAGHIAGAVNMPATNSDLTADSEYIGRVKSTFTPTKKIYIYGGKDSWGTIGNVLPSLLAKTWGEDNTILLDGGFDTWVKAGYEVVQ